MKNGEIDFDAKKDQFIYTEDGREFQINEDKDGEDDEDENDNEERKSDGDDNQFDSDY